jgi:hypothetical protein
VQVHRGILQTLRSLYLFLQIDNNVGTAFKAVAVISDSILSKKVANEKDVVLTSEHLEASLRRSSSESMNGSSVKFSPSNDAQINFPTAFDPKSLGGGNVVDVVVNILLFTIIVWLIY